MDDSRFARLAPLTGAASVVLFFAAAVLYGFYEYRPPAATVQQFFNEHATNLYYGGYLGILSAFLLMWFSGSVYRALRQHEAGEGRLAITAAGGGFAAGIAIALAFTALVTVAGFAGQANGIGATEAALLNELFGGGVVAAGFPLAVLIGAVSLVSLRSAMLPGWFGWLSALIALALLTPFGWIVVAPAMAWLLAMSVWLYRREATR